MSRSISRASSRWSIRSTAWILTFPSTWITTTPIRTCTFTSPKARAFRHNNDGTGYGTEDIGRIGTQQAFLKAVAKQLLQIGNVKNIPALVDIFYTYVKTDLTTGNLVWLGNEALNIGTENIHFATLPGDGSGYYNKQSVYVLDAQATCDLVNEALNPYNEALTLEDMDILVP